MEFLLSFISYTSYIPTSFGLFGSGELAPYLMPFILEALLVSPKFLKKIKENAERHCYLEENSINIHTHMYIRTQYTLNLYMRLCL